MLDSHGDVFERAKLIVKVKEPLPSELPLLRPNHILFTYLHLAASKPLTEALMQSGATAIAYETVEVNRHLPLLEPMSEIAGRMSILVGGYLLAKHQGGSGTLLGGVPGVLPGKVVDVKRGATPILKNPSAKVWDLGDGVACFEFTSRANTIASEGTCTLKVATCWPVEGLMVAVTGCVPVFISMKQPVP